MSSTVNYRDKRALVIDNGLFVHVAVKLAETFGHVDYWTPSVDAFPKSNRSLPGQGIEGVTRVIEFWTAARQADLVVFADVMFGDEQEECVRQGMRVWGSRRGEDLELKRWETKRLLVSLNMPVAESHLITGMAALREFIQERPDFWVKTSRYRGDFETFHATDYDDVKPRLDDLQHDLGMKAEVYKFVLERNIPDVPEIGYDGYVVDGQFPEHVAFGFEQKDTGYVGVFKAYDELPEPVRWANAKLAPRFKAVGYRGFYSSEVRCQDAGEVTPPPKPWRDAPMLWCRGETVGGFRAYLTDPCCRAASPPSEAYIEWFTNWPDIIWHGAAGVLVDAQAAAKYAVEIMLHSSWADRNWQPVRFPEDIERWVKLRNACRINGVWSAVPQAVGLPEIGAVIGLDDTLAGAIQLAVERADQVQGYYIEPRSESVQKTVAKIAEAEEAGIEFSGEALPTPDQIEELSQ